MHCDRHSSFIFFPWQRKVGRDPVRFAEGPGTRISTMTIAEFSKVAFIVFNAIRMIGYMPQIRCLCRDGGKGSAVSLATWSLFSLANATTVAYAVFVIKDWLMAIVFLFNLTGSLTISLIIVHKRYLTFSYAQQTVRFIVQRCHSMW